MSGGVRLSVVVPVLNEAGGINETIGRLRAIDPAGVAEIIVVDGDPGGSTLAVIEDPGVMKLLSKKGRAMQMNRGAAEVSGEVILFLHADTVLPPGAVADVLGAMDTGRYVAGAFDIGFNSKRPIFRVMERVTSARSRLTRTPYGDQALFIGRDYFIEIGGFAEIPLMEDIELMRRIKGRGDEIHIIPKRAVTSTRRWDRDGYLYCLAKNLTLSSLYYLGVKPEKLVKFYK